MAVLLLRGVTVIDVQDGRRLPDRTVTIVGNRITAVEASGGPMPAGAQVLDAPGTFLIPGLWDLHVHPMRATEQIYPLLLANGVTGFRDPASPVPLDTLVRWRREILAGTRVGPPRQLLSGPALDGTSSCTRTPNTAHICVAGGDATDVQHVVDSLRAAGADFIKTYGLSAALYFQVAAAARRAGVPFGGHTPVAAIQSSDSGARLIGHPVMGGLAETGWGPNATVDACREVAEHFRRHHTWWVPTATRMHVEQPAGSIEPWAASAPIAARLAEFGRAFWDDSAGAAPDRFTLEGVSGAEAGARDSLGALSLARQVGLPILAGTDATAEVVSLSPLAMLAGAGATQPIQDVAPGYSLHAELAMYVAEGLTPLAALQSATLNPARLLGATDSLGTVAPGKLADLVLLDADPLADITNTTAIRAVVANGRYYDRTALDQLLRAVRTATAKTP